MRLLRYSILAVTVAVAALAQPVFYRINVPFEFVAGDKTLPAGQYSVGFNMNTSLIALTCVDHNGSAVLVGIPLPAVSVIAPYPEHPKKLVFHRYTNTQQHTKTYFLTQVWIDDAFRKQLPMTKGERELKVQLSNADNVVVAAAR